MAIRSINTNLASLNAQRQLSRVTSELDQTFQRLSSGLRINRASDDAAGLSVAKGIEADSRVYKQGVRNLNDAISYLDIADGAQSSLKVILFRARELATQAANGTLGKSQRSRLNEELS
ncbi:MAG: hypothetical protein IT290_04645 [Deltaproteobacteria bacterium]|nr:hypothetical protein [Deltaproteobacteria bacterium]